MTTTAISSLPDRKIVNAPKFGPAIKADRITAELEQLMLKRVMVTFTPDKVIIGKLGRNSFKNQTLCLTTGQGDEDLYGKFFFEPSQATIQEIL